MTNDAKAVLRDKLTSLTREHFPSPDSAISLVATVLYASNNNMTQAEATCAGILIQKGIENSSAYRIFDLCAQIIDLDKS